MSDPLYTTRLGAGLGLVLETARLLDLWQPGMSPHALLRLALGSGAFPTVSARRLRNVVIEAFAPRYLVEEGRPARLLKALNGQGQATDLRQLMFLYTCRANPILGDFVREVYWTRYAAGAHAITKEDAVGFVRRAVARGRTIRTWSSSTIVRMSSYLLGSCADFGLVGDMRSGERAIVPFRIAAVTTLILSHDLHFRGLGDNAVMQHPDWALFGLERDDVLQEMRLLALRGEIILQAAAAIAHVGWKHQSMEELADVLAES